MLPAHRFETGEIGEGSGGSLAVGRPEPAGGLTVRGVGQRPLDAVVVQGRAPFVPHGGVAQAHAVGVIQQSLAELAGRNDDARRVQAGKLGRHHVVGQRAGADHDGAVGGVGQGAQPAANALHQGGELGGTMRERRPAEGAHHRIGHGHGAGRQDHRLAGRRVHLVVEQAGELGAHVAHGPVHGLVGGVVIAHDGSEGDEADVPVQGLLGHAAGHDHVVVAAFLAVAGHHGQQAGEDTSAAHVGAHRQQADLADAGALGLGQVGLEAAQLFVQGEGPAVADADHADEVMIPAADEVGVLVVEAVNEDAGVVGGMLGHLLDERGVVQLEDFVELPGLVGLLELQRGSMVVTAVRGQVAHGQRPRFRDVALHHVHHVRLGRKPG